MCVHTVQHTVNLVHATEHTKISILSSRMYGLDGSCINGKESSLIPILRSENLANISTEYFGVVS